MAFLPLQFDEDFYESFDPEIDQIPQVQSKVASTASTSTLNSISSGGSTNVANDTVHPDTEGYGSDEYESIKEDVSSVLLYFLYT